MTTDTTSVLNQPLTSTDLPTRLISMFQRRGLQTVGAASTVSYKELSEEKNLGHQSVQAWMAFLECHDLRTGRSA